MVKYISTSSFFVMTFLVSLTILLLLTHSYVSAVTDFEQPEPRLKVRATHVNWNSLRGFSKRTGVNWHALRARRVPSSDEHSADRQQRPSEEASTSLYDNEQNIESLL